ncbi:MAG: hypothetical protein D6771_02625, partial [Zetaproteobacteria bacterium]
NSAAESDLRNIMTAEEAAYADTQSYVSFAITQGPNPITGLDAKLSNNVKALANTNTAGTAYAAFTGHKNGDRVYGGDSNGTIAFKSTTGSDPWTALGNIGNTTTSVPSNWQTL